MRTTKQLRDFVKSHEVRYLAFFDEYSYRKNIGVKKVYKVEVEGHPQWVLFSYSTMPHIVDEHDVKHNIFKTRAEAEARAEVMRKEREVRRKKEAEERKRILDKAAKILHANFYSMTDKDNKLKDEYKKIYAEAAMMVQRYGYEPDESELLRRYVKKLETYIKTGSVLIDDQAINKDSIMCVVKGTATSKVELIDGRTITLIEDDTEELLSLIFGLK